jgi:hypothetical protein
MILGIFSIYNLLNAYSLPTNCEKARKRLKESHCAKFSIASLRDQVESEFLTPKGLRGVFSKKHSKTAISSSRSPTDFFFIFLNF